MKKVLLGAAAVALTLGFAASGAQAQSSKFAAAYDKQHTILAWAFECEPAGGTEGAPRLADFIDCEDPDQDNSGFGVAGHMATIKAPQGKELLLGLSAVPILLTYTEAKGKNGEGFTESVAIAGIGMAVAYKHYDGDAPNAVEVCTTGTIAEPGVVPLSVRLQYLAVNTNLDTTDPDIDVTGDVTVALGLLTAASHHYNFLAPNLPTSGDYAVAACFVGGALADVLDGKEGGAFAVAALGKRILTVQEVRAIKNAEFDVNN